MHDLSPFCDADHKAVGQGPSIDRNQSRLRLPRNQAKSCGQAREFGEEALDGVEPGCGGRGEVEGPAGMAGQPCAHLGMFVGGIVVDDGMDHLSLRHLRLEVLRKRMNS